MSRNGQQKIREKLLTYFGMSLLTVGLTALGINYHLIRENLEKDIEEKTHSLAQTLVFATEGLIENKQIAILQRVVQNYSTLPAIHDVSIVTPKGEFLAHAPLHFPVSSSGFTDNKEHKLLKSLMEEASITGKESTHKIKFKHKEILVNILPFNSNLFRYDERYGLAIVSVDLLAMEQTAWQSFSASTVTLLSGTVVILVMMGLVIRQTILIPLNRLKEAVASSQDTNIFNIPQFAEINEITFLARTFDTVFNQRLKIEKDLRASEERERKKHEELAAVVEKLEDTSEQLDRAKAMVQLNRNLQESEARYRTVVSQTSDGILLVDIKNNKIIEANSAFLKLLKYSEEEISGMRFDDLMFFSEKMEATRFYDRLNQEHQFSGEFIHRCRDNSLVDVEINFSKINYDEREVFCLSVRDITEKKQTREILEYQAFHDLLTNLPNRLSFTETLMANIEQAKNSQTRIAILFLDLDRFKTINDTLGHYMGDILLRQLAERLQQLVGEGDQICRWGGDEFTIILNNIKTREDISYYCDRLIETIKPPFIIEDYELHVSGSVGIAIYPEDGQDCQGLLKHADVALYLAKEQGRDNYQFYRPSINDKAEILLTLENYLHRALEREELFLYYQPQININTGKISGMEALLRWQHPQLGLISPGQFIPLAEESGLILSIGEWVLQTACAQNKAWQDAGLPPINISVNLSARQFQNRNLLARVEEILKDTGLDAKWLDLEITESTLIKNVELASKVLRQLASMGISIAIDDFGTGYSSLGYLKQFCFHSLKVDQSFVRELRPNSVDSAIVSGIITLAKNLELKVIAEGVETAEQLQLLRSFNCDEMQGYYFSKPLNTEEATKLLQENYLKFAQTQEDNSQHNGNKIKSKLTNPEIIHPPIPNCRLT